MRIIIRFSMGFPLEFKISYQYVEIERGEASYVLLGILRGCNES